MQEKNQFVTERRDAGSNFIVVTTIIIGVFRTMKKLFQIYREKEVFATLHGRSCTNWSNEAYGATLEISSDFWLPWNPMRTVEKIEKFDIEKKKFFCIAIIFIIVFVYHHLSSRVKVHYCEGVVIAIKRCESITITVIITGCLIKSLFFVSGYTQKFSPSQFHHEVKWINVSHAAPPS